MKPTHEKRYEKCVCEIVCCFCFFFLRERWLCERVRVFFKHMTVSFVRGNSENYNGKQTTSGGKKIVGEVAYHW